MTNKHINKVFSNKKQLESIREMLEGYLRLPFSTDAVPGSFLENVISHVRSGEVLKTYDFVDVINKDLRVGWQVKSTKYSTPVTWKRAKIPNSPQLISESRKNPQSLQNLGNTIIHVCNKHAWESMEKYDLDEIGYARLVIYPNGNIMFFEKILCTRSKPKIFDEDDFFWTWSPQKKAIKKEQLQSLHGIHRANKEKWFAWHGLGENQLHFSGEKNWWPPENDGRIIFSPQTNKLDQEKFIEFLKKMQSSI